MSVNLGITGKLYKSKGLFYVDYLSNKAEADATDDEIEDEDSEGEVSKVRKSMTRRVHTDKRAVGFNSDIDNLAGVRDIQNFILAAMIDDNDQGVLECKGVIQIFNKDPTRVVNPQLSQRDIHRIEAIQKLLGAAVTRSEVYSNCLSTLMGLGMFLEESSVVGSKSIADHDEFIHSMYDCANIVQPMEAVRRHLDSYNANMIDRVGYGLQ